MFQEPIHESVDGCWQPTDPATPRHDDIAQAIANATVNALSDREFCTKLIGERNGTSDSAVDKPPGSGRTSSHSTRAWNYWRWWTPAMRPPFLASQI